MLKENFENSKELFEDVIDVMDRDNSDLNLAAVRNDAIAGLALGAGVVGYCSVKIAKKIIKKDESYYANDN